MKTFKELLSEDSPLLLPVADTCLAARLIERAGFKAMQCGNFALAATHRALPDIGLMQFGEQFPIVQEILKVTGLPILVDTDCAGNNPKDTVRIVQNYERIGAGGIFFEDQIPGRQSCGHLLGKQLVSRESYIAKLRAALDTRKSDSFFVLSRTDSWGTEGLDGVKERGAAYLKEGADGLFVDGLKNEEDLRAVGTAFKGETLATTMLEGGDEQLFSPSDMYEMGFSLILYPTSLLFRVAQVITDTLRCMLAGNLQDAPPLMTMNQFEQEIGMGFWHEIEVKYEQS